MLTFFCHHRQYMYSFYSIKTTLKFTVYTAIVNTNTLTWHSLYSDLIYSFLEEAVGVRWLTAGKNNVLYTVIWIYSTEAQSNNDDRHLGKTKLGFHVYCDGLFSPGNFQVSVFLGFFSTWMDDSKWCHIWAGEWIHVQ